MQSKSATSAKAGQKPASGKTKKSAKRSRKNFDPDLAKAVERLLGVRVKRMEFPGGRKRKSCLLFLEDGRGVITTVRSSRKRAATECAVLKALGRKVPTVPELLASDGDRLVIQEYLPGVRLTQALYGADKDQTGKLLDESLTSLSEIQQTGSAEGFDEKVNSIGDTRKWLVGLLDRPAVFGQHLGLPAPRPQLSKLLELLQVVRPRFVKWDTRPGNAMVLDDGRVAWFDWEHCGARNRLDDVAWLLCDEFVADFADVEERLLDKHLENFADGLDIEHARTYLSAYGVFHSCVRLGLILKYKKDDDWWNLEKCIAGDKVGMTQETAIRICVRASRWSARTPLTKVLEPWFLDVAGKLESL